MQTRIQTELFERIVNGQRNYDGVSMRSKLDIGSEYFYREYSLVTGIYPPYQPTGRWIKVRISQVFPKVIDIYGCKTNVKVFYFDVIETNL